MGTVTVVGSLNEDVLVTVDRLPGRGETVVGTATRVAPGGKGANQAAAAGRLGAAVTMVGRVGDDPAGERQRAALAAAGVDVGPVRTVPGEPTGTATIPVEAAGGENLIVVVPGANAALRPGDVRGTEVRTATVVLLQLENPLDAVQAAAEAATGTVVLNPAPAQPLPAALLSRVDVLVPNEHELAGLGGAPAAERTPAELAGLARRLGARAVVVTLGARGALVVPATGTVFLQAPPPVPARDTTGAGDCFCGALATALARGDDLAAAVRYAVAAAAASTTGPGARGGAPGDAEVRALLERTPVAVAVAGAGAAGRAPARLPGRAAGNGVGMTENAPQRASDVDQPDGGAPSRGEKGTGRTPHPEQPAEGPDVDEEAPGVDPDTRITGA